MARKQRQDAPQAPSEPTNDLEARIDMATRYAGLGWRVLPWGPVGAGEGDYPNRWPNKATSNPDRIRELFEAYPDWPGIARLLQDRDLVIDLDRHNPSEDGIEVFEALCDEIAPTWRWLNEIVNCQTRRKGLHLLFKLPPGVTVKTDTIGATLGPGTETRAEGTLEHLPVSERGWGVSPFESEIGEIPDFLLTKILEAQAKPKTGGKAERGSEAGTKEPQDMETGAGLGEGEEPEELDSGSWLTKADSDRFKQVEAALRRVGSTPRKVGPQKLRAKCPVHGGPHPDSLAVELETSGIILLKCHSKTCTVGAVMRALKLPQSILFRPRLQEAVNSDDNRPDWGFGSMRYKATRPFFVQGVLREGDLGLVCAGGPDVGLSISVTIAAGGKVFGLFEASPRPTVHFDGGLSEAAMRETGERLALGMEVEDPDALPLVLASGRENSIVRALSNPSTLRLIEETLEAGSVLTLASVDRLGGDRQAVMRWIRKLRRSGVTVILTQTSHRLPREEREEFDFLAWFVRGELWIHRAAGDDRRVVPVPLSLYDAGEATVWRVGENLRHLQAREQAERLPRSSAREILGVKDRMIRRYLSRIDYRDLG